jgi:hypothetical protein
MAQLSKIKKYLAKSCSIPGTVNKISPSGRRAEREKRKKRVEREGISKPPAVLMGAVRKCANDTAFKGPGHVRHQGFALPDIPAKKKAPGFLPLTAAACRGFGWAWLFTMPNKPFPS